MADRWMTQFGTAKAVFQQDVATLTRVGKVKAEIVRTLKEESTLTQSAKVLAAHTKAHIQLITPWEATYPERLKHIYKVPLTLYLKGSVNLNTPKIISVVGTRNATMYGKKVIETLLHDLRAYQPIIISGLAYGIDIHAHRTALTLGLSTLAVVASGVDKIYPAEHKREALALCKEGGILSEHPLHTLPKPYRFVTRNRIIAGISDATIVVEAGEKSGAAITARYANEYNREVFAVCGAINAPYSVGCHHLIKTHQAHLMSAASDLIKGLNWESKPITKVEGSAMTSLNLTALEQKVLHIIGRDTIHMDTLSQAAQVPPHQLASLLLNLELRNIVSSLPGNRFTCA